MIYHQAKDPTAYQTIFYRQIGLKKQEEETGNSWRDDEGGYIYTFGTMDTIQMGIGAPFFQWLLLVYGDPEDQPGTGAFSFFGIGRYESYHGHQYGSR